MKKISILALAAVAVLGLCGCNNGNSTLPDTDFDGLKNEIDPDPNNNQYLFHAADNLNNQVTKQDQFTMDYRVFLRDDLTSKYNPALGKLSSLILNESYNENIVIENNVYTSSSSSISKLLTQIGCEDIEFKNISLNSFAEDIYDVVNLKLGHHVVVERSKKVNVVFVEVIGYPTDAQWASNFDVGSDGQDYIYTTGSHSEWLDKKNHKGFDVSAKRAVDFIESYLSGHKVTDIKDLVFITGHSRGAAVSSLIGKKLKDDNIDSLVYAFNTPLHTADTTKEVLESYNNIWQIINEEDFVSKVPLPSWNNFSLLGHVLKYKISEHAEDYNNYFLNASLPPIDPDLVGELEGGIFKLANSREALYKFRAPDEDYDEVILKLKDRPFRSIEEAENRIEEYYDAFDDKEAAKKIIQMEVGPYSEDETKFQINYKTKPQVVISLITDVVKNSPITTDTITDIVKAYLPFLKRYLYDISDELLYFVSGIPDTINQIMCSHEQHITLLSCTFFN